MLEKQCSIMHSRVACPAPMQVYEYAAAVLRQAGWGAVRDLTAPVLECALLELYSGKERTSAQQPSEAPGKKRKRQKAQAAQQQSDLAALAKGAPPPGSVQVLCCMVLLR